MLRTFAGLSLLVTVACGSAPHDPDPAGLPDAMPGPTTPDAMIDPPPPTDPAAITVLRGSSALTTQGVVYFNGPDGTLLGEVPFDADGRASRVCPPDTTVTVRLTVGLFTVVDAQPGDVIRMVFPQTVAAQDTLHFGAPAAAGATQVRGQVGPCLMPNVEFDEGEPSTSWDVALQAGCIGVDARDEGLFFALDAEDRVVAAATHDGIGADPFQLAWQTAVPQALSFSHLPVGAEATLQWSIAQSFNVLWNQDSSATIVEGEGTALFEVRPIAALSPGMAVRFQVERQDGSLLHQRLLQAKLDNEVTSLDGDAVLLPEAELPALEQAGTGRVRVSWAGQAARTGSDGVHVALGGVGAGWWILAPASRTEVVTPVLPAPYGVLTADGLEASIVFVDLVDPKGYAALRREIGLLGLAYYGLFDGVLRESRFSAASIQAGPQ